MTPENSRRRIREEGKRGMGRINGIGREGKGRG